LRLAPNQDQPIGNDRFYRVIQEMTGQRRELHRRGRPRKWDDEGVRPPHNVHQMVPCRVDDTRKRDLAQRRKGAEKKRKREGEEKRAGNIEQCAFFLCASASLRLCASFFLSSLCASLLLPHCMGFDIILRPYPSDAASKLDSSANSWRPQAS
jgi:hypothetical protein